MSVRTLRYYDKMELLSPSQYTEAGYRLYTDEDLANLQQILALKFLGFSLDEIRIWLQTEPERLHETLAQQKAMMRERRNHLDTIIEAIEETEKLLQADQSDWESIVRVIRVIQMEQKNDWRRKYFTEEQLQQMQELSSKSYSEEARERLALRAGKEWTEEDQKRVDERYGALHTGIKRLVAGGGDPASPEAQDLARQSIELQHEFTGGDPELEAGLHEWWKSYRELPAGKRPFPPPLSEEESGFLGTAKTIYSQRQPESGGA